MATGVRFNPVRGVESQILAQPKSNGNIYFAKDTGKIYLDISHEERILVGNSGISIFYTFEENIRQNPDSETGYILTLTEIENYGNCRISDLILNQADGSFYKVEDIIGEDVYVIRLSISGGGGGGGSLARDMSIRAVQEKPLSSIVNGQEANAIITVKSDTDDEGIPYNENINVIWRLYVAGSTTFYKQGNFTVKHNEPYTFEYGTQLRHNTTSNIEFIATDSNRKEWAKSIPNITTVELTLSESTRFSKTSLHSSEMEFRLYCEVNGAINKKITFTIDPDKDEPMVQTKTLSSSDIGTISSEPFKLTHGAHKARIELYSFENGILGNGPQPLEFEFAYVETGNKDPIVWLGNYQDTYYSYDKIQVPYLAYDPTTVLAAVKFYKGSSLLESKGTNVDWSSGSVSFHLFEITDATVDAQNIYTIMCGNITSTIMFECKTDPNRDMNIITDGLMLKFDAMGRSNNESSVNREIWTYDYKSITNPENNKVYTGIFRDFNWYNNGWILDKDNNTCLRISNGASFEIPIGALELNTSTEGKKSCTFEFEFKVKNIQNYTKVIKEFTRYKFVTTVNGSTKTFSDANAYAAFSSQSKYDNYDTFLNAMHESGVTNLKYYIHEDATYDKLEISGVEKVRNPQVAFAKYFGTTGFCLGSQDGFFFNGVDTVNTKYVEDKLVNLSIVFDRDADIIMCYLNGVLSSVAKISVDGKITLDGGSLIFNSNVCDIDLYKFRVYNKALDVRQIGLNYAVDHRDVLVYDQSKMLAIANANLKGEYQVQFDSMLQYNNEHKHDYLMPYLIIDTTNATTDNGGIGAGVLPYRKSVKTNGVHVTFVNTGLEYAYENGELGPLAQEAGYVDDPEGLTAVQQYYMHHCPSWTSYWPTTENGALQEVVDLNPQSKKAVNMAVQGTSSEFYPRRNYKIKLKGKDKEGEDLIFMYMNKGPFAQKYLDDPASTQLKYFYYDNNTVGTTTFTLKVDYMESSGSYNMGFANFVKNAYTKHPLHDYNKAGAFEKVSETYPKANSFTEGTKYYVYNAEDDKYEKAEEQPTAGNFSDQTYYTQVKTYTPYQFDKLEDYRTSVQGFPVMAFHKNDKATSADKKYIFIGLYRMLLDKGSDEVYGFKPDKKIVSKFLDREKTRDMVECWEFSDNSRTWGSYNDPLGRDELSFSYPDPAEEGGEKLNEPEGAGKGGAPFVANTFEYRYNQHEDLLDYLYQPESPDYDQDTVDEIQENYEDYNIRDQKDRNELFFKIHENWEKACKWLYSTKIENRPSQNAFSVASGVTADNFASGTYYIKTDEILYEVAEGPFDPVQAYYKKFEKRDENDEIIEVYYEYAEGLTAEDYAKDTYYIQNTTGYIKAETFDPKETYYIADFSYKDEKNKLTTPIKYGNVTYEYDTQEYRLAKFKNELSEHFDLEYCLVYFLMTEIFMCYDSRGKNCMMASWGPLKEGGDYIWYPIFYDIDTQLGINNTGIPSFEYYINATQEGSYSTNDSVLWMNLFRAFFPEIKSKYYAMRGAGNGIVNIHTGKTTTPLKGKASTSITENVEDLVSTVDHIEKWYSADSEECNSLSMRGARPFIVKNLDEYYKYISITNNTIGYQGREGELLVDDGGTYFYALQGDRSLSRQQFLSNRINFIDSWLNHGEYARGGSAIFGRIGANDHRNDKGEKVYSDFWLHTDDDSLVGTPVPTNPALEYNHYYDENGKKSNYLDADITVTLAPYQASYVAIGGDNGITASKQYNGTPLELELPAGVVKGRLTAPEYGEQLFYIYGTKSLQDLGDMSTLYWTEFYATKSPRLKSLLLGNNHPDFFNYSMNYPNFDASSDSAYGKPLLEKVNLDNVRLTDSAGKFTFDFSSSEKLKHFEALGSNTTGVTFAAGVALDTLYLPDTVSILKLVEARKLNNLITELPMPKDEEEFFAWNPDEHKGLYVEGLTNLINEETIDSGKYSNINIYHLNGGNLGYGSYRLLNTLYKLKNTPTANAQNADKLAVTLTDVNWNAYEKLVEGDTYDVSKYSYYLDNRHYELVEYAWKDSEEFNKYILDGRLYKLAKNAEIPNYIQNIDLLLNIAESNNFSNTNAENSEIPIVTGIMHVNNSDKYEESYIKNELLKDYPNLQIFCKEITKARSANFIMVDDVTGAEKLVATQKIAVNSGKTWFEENPFSDAYKALVAKNHWVFKGWKLNDTLIENEDQWKALGFDGGNLDYDFYAVLEHETYQVKFYDGDGKLFETQNVVYGEFAQNPAVMPSKVYTAEEEEENIFGGYVFKHYALSPNSSSSINLASYPITAHTDFYSVFTKVEDLREYVNYDYFMFEETRYEELEWGDPSYNEDGYVVYPKPGMILSGKITIPAKYNGKPVLDITGFYEQKITHMFFEKDSRLRKISTGAFYVNSSLACKTLKYFDFIDSIRYIGSNAFRTVPLEMKVYNLPKNLYYIEDRVFNAAFKSAVPIVINIPSSVRVMNWFAFANNGSIPATGNIINIGSAESKSELDLSRASDNGNDGYKLISSERFTEINFYTDLYNSGEDTFQYGNRGEKTLTEALDKAATSYGYSPALQIIH